MVDKFFTPEELEPSRKACAELVGQLADFLHKAGKIQSHGEKENIGQIGLRLNERLTQLDIMTEAKKRFPGQVDETHPELFDIRAMPPQPTEKKPGQLPESTIRQFFEEGYIAVDKFFTPEELEPSRKACAELVDQLADFLHKAGKIQNLYKESGLFQRLTHIEKEFPGASILAMKRSGKLTEEFQDLWSNPRLLNVIEQLIGPDVMACPLWTLRPNAPHSENAETPWHQDAGYFDPRGYKTLVVTAWIPLLDTYEKNGCLEMLPRGHLKGKVATHLNCWGETWNPFLEEEEMEKTLGVSVKEHARLVPVPFGGLLLFNNMIPHRGCPNVSNEIRWSVDFRFQRSGTCIAYKDMEGVVLRSKDDPDLVINWDPMMNFNFRIIKDADDGKNDNQDEAADLDTTVHGLWMIQWETVHPTRHSAHFKA